MAKHINITDDIKNKINDFLNGDDKYWKNQYNKVMNQLKNINVLKRIKEAMLKDDHEIYQNNWRRGYHYFNY